MELYFCWSIYIAVTWSSFACTSRSSPPWSSRHQWRWSRITNTTPDEMGTWMKCKPVAIRGGGTRVITSLKNLRRNKIRQPLQCAFTRLLAQLILLGVCAFWILAHLSYLVQRWELPILIQLWEKWHIECKAKKKKKWRKWRVHPPLGSYEFTVCCFAVGSGPWWRRWGRCHVPCGTSKGKPTPQIHSTLWCGDWCPGSGVFLTVKILYRVIGH